MAVTINLDITIVETNSPFTMAVGDMTIYPTGYSIISPTIQITPPGYKSVILSFTPKNINVYDSLSLGITCEDEEKAKLPDGLYRLKYTFTPAYTYFIEKTFMKVDMIAENLDDLFISLDLLNCNSGLSDKDNRKLSDINNYIQFSIACANKCMNNYAIDSYQKALKLINSYNKNRYRELC